jgi:CheY-like chemotaxis protein
MDMKHANILIVDDDAMLGEQLRSLLGVLGHKAVYLSDPERALLLVEELDFDLVFCDFWIPPHGGKHFYQQLLKCRPDLGPRLVFLINSVLGDETQFFIHQTGNPQLLKPFKLPAIQQVLKQTLTLPRGPVPTPPRFNSPSKTA